MEKNNKIEEFLIQVNEDLLYGNLVAQIKKDFLLANIHVDWPSEILPKKLISLLHEKLYVLIMEKFNAYLNLLYVINIKFDIIMAQNFSSNS